MEDLVRLFGISTKRLKGNYCLSYQTKKSGVFQYHNFTNVEAARVDIFSRIIDDILFKKVRAQHCHTCRHTDLNSVQPEKKHHNLYDKEEVDRVNFTLRSR